MNNGEKLIFIWKIFHRSFIFLRRRLIASRQMSSTQWTRKKMLHNLAGNIWMCWCIEWEMELKKMNTKKSKTFFCITTWSNNLSSDKCQKVVRLWSLNYIKLEATLHLWSLYIFRECRSNTHIRKCSTKSSWTCLCTRIKIDTD